jgi:hypothetical protein
VARWIRSGLAVPGPFGCRCLSIQSLARFHIPLIKPDVQISRIRLTPAHQAFAFDGSPRRTRMSYRPSVSKRYLVGN